MLLPLPFHASLFSTSFLAKAAAAVRAVPVSPALLTAAGLLISVLANRSGLAGKAWLSGSVGSASETVGSRTRCCVIAQVGAPGALGKDFVGWSAYLRGMLMELLPQALAASLRSVGLGVEVAGGQIDKTGLLQIGESGC